jgi:hypothetical protein
MPEDEFIVRYFQAAATSGVSGASFRIPGIAKPVIDFVLPSELPSTASGSPALER